MHATMKSLILGLAAQVALANPVSRKSGRSVLATSSSTSVLSTSPPVAKHETLVQRNTKAKAQVDVDEPTAAAAAADHSLSKCNNNTFYPDPAAYPDAAPENPPKTYAMPLFPAFDMMDVFGPLDVLNILSKSHEMNLYLVSDTLDPVSTAPLDAPRNSSSFFPTINPTHTFATVPSDIDVVIVPGGPGVRQEEATLAARTWLRELFSPSNDTAAQLPPPPPPPPKHLLTICTGAGLAAQAGLLDGRKATTNKFGWAAVREMGPAVDWVAPARYVRDGNVWSSSGVTAGLDLTFAFVGREYGAYSAARVAGIVEHDPLPADRDHWAETWRVEATGGRVGEDGVVVDEEEEEEEEEGDE